MAEGCQAVPTANPAILEVRGLAVRAGTRWLLRNVNLAVPLHQIFGLWGRPVRARAPCSGV
jgi:ABC-type transporter Mla maintaining outer membrane lipid asymmetry ATPase subunit MlaF